MRLPNTQPRGNRTSRSRAQTTPAPPLDPNGLHSCGMNRNPGGAAPVPRATNPRNARVEWVRGAARTQHRRQPRLAGGGQEQRGRNARSKIMGELPDCQPPRSPQKDGAVRSAMPLLLLSPRRLAASERDTTEPCSLRSSGLHARSIFRIAQPPLEPNRTSREERQQPTHEHCPHIPFRLEPTEPEQANV